MGIHALGENVLSSERNYRTRSHSSRSVILSEVTGRRSRAVTQSKDPVFPHSSKGRPLHRKTSQDGCPISRAFLAREVGTLPVICRYTNHSSSRRFQSNFML